VAREVEHLDEGTVCTWREIRFGNVTATSGRLSPDIRTKCSRVSVEFVRIARMMGQNAGMSHVPSCADGVGIQLRSKAFG